MKQFKVLFNIGSDKDPIYYPIWVSKEQMVDLSKRSKLKKIFNKKLKKSVVKILNTIFVEDVDKDPIIFVSFGEKYKENNTTFIKVLFSKGLESFIYPIKCYKNMEEDAKKDSVVPGSFFKKLKKR